MHCLAVVCILLLGCYQASAAGNCSQVAPITLHRPGSVYEVGSLAAVLFPGSNGVPVPGARVEWKFFSLIERLRIQNDIHGDPLPSSKCNSPSSADFTLSEQPNPFKPANPSESCVPGDDKPCGELLRTLNADDMDCWFEHIIAPFYGTSRESVLVHFSHPSHPDFRMIAGFHLTDDAVTIYPIQNSTLISNRYMYVPINF
jgi:hypothetical protein